MKKLLTILLVLTMCMVALPTTLVVFAAEPTPTAPVEITPDYSWYGDGSADTFEIDSVADLAGLAKLTQGNVVIDETTTLNKTNFAGKTVKLTANLTFAEGQYWYYRSSDSATIYDYRIGEFAGAFDGQNNTITGLKFYNANISENPYMYLFNTITAAGSIKNITLDTVTADINGYDYFGFLAKTLKGTATNCHVKNATANVDVNNANKAYLSQTAAMFGSVSSATIEGCTVSGFRINAPNGVDTTDIVGALIGNSSGTSDQNTTITNCSVDDVEFVLAYKTKRFGGFVGSTGNTSIVNCTATDVKISVGSYYQNVGGFVGTVGSGSTFTRCTIDNIVIDLNSSDYGGYVGGFSSSVSGDNISFVECSVTNLDIDVELRYKNYGYVGGFACNVGGSGTITFENCLVSGNITAEDFDSNSPVGGFFGYTSNSNLTVSECVTNVDVTVPYAAGGFVGQSSAGTFTDCEVNGNVSGGTAGGFIGTIVPGASASLTISDCSVGGSVLGSETASGFVGTIQTGDGTKNTNVNISNSTAAPLVAGASKDTAISDFAQNANPEGVTASNPEINGETGAIATVKPTSASAITFDQDGRIVVDANTSVQVNGGETVELTNGGVVNVSGNKYTIRHTRIEQLDLTSLATTTDKLATEGWAWDADTKTLTLDSIDLSVSTTPAVTAPAGTTIILADGSVNSIKTSDGSDRGIQCNGSLTVKTADGAENKGTLNIVTGKFGRGIIWRIETSGTTENTAVAFDFSNINLNIKSERGIENSYLGSSNGVKCSVTMTDVIYNFSSESTGYVRGIQVSNYLGDATITATDSTLNCIGAIMIEAKESYNATLNLTNSFATAVSFSNPTCFSIGNGSAGVAIANLTNSTITAYGYKGGFALLPKDGGTTTINATNTTLLTISSRSNGYTTIPAQGGNKETVIVTNNDSLSYNIEGNKVTSNFPANTKITSGGTEYKIPTATNDITFDRTTGVTKIPANTVIQTADESTTYTSSGKLIFEPGSHAPHPEEDNVLIVEKSSITNTYTIDYIDEVIYMGLAHTPAVVVKKNDTLVTVGITAKYQDNVDAGMATVTIMENNIEIGAISFKIAPAKTEITVDTSDIVVVSGKEWTLPIASSNFGTVKVNPTVDEMKAVGVYTVTYSVDETSNYSAAQKQIKVTVIVDPATVQENLDEAVENLNNAIAQNKTDLTAEIKAVDTAYQVADKALELALQGKIDANTQEIADLKLSLNAAVQTLETAVQKVQDNLDQAVADLEKAIDGGDKDLQSKIDALDIAYQAADALINSSIADLENADIEIKESIADLEASLITAKTELETAIEKVQTNLDKAVEDLNNAIAQSKADLSAEIKALESAYQSADAIMNAAIADLARKDAVIKTSISTLESSLANVQTSLQNAVDSVAGNLETAKSELNMAIVNGDAVLDKKIAALDEAYKAADALIDSALAELAADDTAIRESMTTLENALETVKGDLEAAIAQVQSKLENARAELEAKDAALAQKDSELAQKDAELHDKITVVIVFLSVIGAISVGSAVVIAITFVKKRKG